MKEGESEMLLRPGRRGKLWDMRSTSPSDNIFIFNNCFATSRAVAKGSNSLANEMTGTLREKAMPQLSAKRKPKTKNEQPAKQRKGLRHAQLVSPGTIETVRFSEKLSFSGNSCCFSNLGKKRLAFLKGLICSQLRKGQ